MKFAPLQNRPPVQAKLQLGQANDRFEREADLVADRVVQQSPDPASIQRKCADCQNEDLQMKPFSSTAGLTIQRMGGMEEEEEVQMKSFQSGTPAIQLMGGMEEEEESLQMKGNGPVAASASLEQQLAGQRGGGQSLSPEVQQGMEQHIGADFSRVKVHTDSSAVQMNQELNARAFTNGSDIYFNSGQYQPESKGGQHLLAHELTHVVQQGYGGK